MLQDKEHDLLVYVQSQSVIGHRMVGRIKINTESYKFTDYLSSQAIYCKEMVRSRGTNLTLNISKNNLPISVRTTTDINIPFYFICYIVLFI